RGTGSRRLYKGRIKQDDAEAPAGLKRTVLPELFHVTGNSYGIPCYIKNYRTVAEWKELAWINNI
ncbi:MAG: hypothetical protein EGQ17_03590, partial [Lachnospiraceae bacterium]|nr:hypothetical protein [Lachnospiraceae bacterium]